MKFAFSREATEQSAAMLALVSWVALAAALLPGLAADPLEFTPWHWLVFACALLGAAGGVLWMDAVSRARMLLWCAACGYLAVMAARFFFESAGRELELGDAADALRFALWWKGQQLTHAFAHGRPFEGLALTFYEALMPAFQLIVLAGLAGSRRR